MAKTKNQLKDLNDHLFAQMERLGDENLTSDQLKQEIDRGKAITSVANSIISNASLALDAAKFNDEMGLKKSPFEHLEDSRKDTAWSPQRLTN